jgi:tetratricopeptide (TPR) repeat protein
MSKPPSNPAAVNDPSFIELGRPLTIAEALERADLALRSQSLDEAARLAGGVLQADPDNVEAGQILGTALLVQDRSAEAVAPLERAARLSEDPHIETLLARALTNVGRREEAVDRLREATTRRPAYPQAFLELGDQLGAAGRFEEAAGAFEEGLELLPDAAVLRVGLAYLLLKCNDRSRARALFEEVRAAAPQRFDALLGLAWATAADGEYAAAARLFETALDSRPGDAVVRLELAKCLLELGEREAGEAALRAAAGGLKVNAGPALVALAGTPHGRFFLKPSDAAKFLGLGDG